jgi:hypothetical protein
MLFNHRHQQVADYTEGDSLCPLCSGPLIAKRGDIVIWHWAHKAKPNDRNGCPFAESAWHLSWKSAYLNFKDWEVEYPIVIDGQKYVIDAVNPATGRVREFVHSLSPYYEAKHQRLLHQFTDISWLFDYRVFGSSRGEYCRDGRGVKNLLKPRALLCAQTLQPHAKVHLGAKIMRCWKENIWYPIDSGKADRVIECQAQAMRDLMGDRL